MTGRPFLPSSLPGGAPAITLEAALGADLTDSDGSGWTWTDLSSRLQHTAGTSVTIGRSDNVFQAGAASLSATLDNSDGALTPVSNADITQNTPIRQRITLTGSTFLTRFQGYADSFNPVYNTTGKVKQISLTALGMLGRLGGQKKPLRSALYRGMHAASPVAYWPLEDGATATEGVSDVLGVSAARVAGIVGSVVFGAAGLGGAASGVDHSQGGSLRMQPPAFATSSGWQLTETFQIGSPGPGATEFWPLYLVGSTGWAIALQMFPDSAGTLSGEVNYHRTDGAGNTTSGLLAGLGPIFPANSIHNVTVTVAQNSSNVDIGLIVDGVAFGVVDSFAGSRGLPTQIYTGPTLEQMAQVGGSVSTTLTGAYVVSNVGVYVGTTPAADFYTLATGWAGEAADDRLFRLCAEENIFLDMHGTSTVTMGAQGVDTILNLLRECEAADHGLLADGTNAGLYYQTRNQRYNATAALTLDVSAKQLAPPFNPRFDRQAVKNLYAVSRKGGGSKTFERTDGPVGTDTVGVEDAAATVNIDSDDPLIQHAGWLVGLGTVPGFRYPGVPLDLRSIPSKAASLLVALPGFRTTLSNPDGPDPDFPGDDIDLFVEGWTEITTATSWKITLNTSPFSPYRVFILDVDKLDDPAVHLAL